MDCISTDEIGSQTNSHVATSSDGGQGWEARRVETPSREREESKEVVVVVVEGMGSCGGGAGGGCQSECCRDREEDEDDAVRTEDLKRCSGSCSGDQSPANDGRGLCNKCLEIAAVYNNLCGACFRFSLYGKFKAAVTSNGMISPTDKVLVALSGGPASRF